MVEIARKQSRELGVLNNSITTGEGNISGFLGEFIVFWILPFTQPANSFDYDLITNGLKIDVKTKRTTVTPRSYYDCSVAAFNTTQQTDYYVFTRILEDFTTGWILGYLPKDHYFEQARFHTRGELDHENNFIFKADCYNITIRELLPITDLIRILLN